jgi:hypothetical protein
MNKLLVLLALVFIPAWGQSATMKKNLSDAVKDKSITLKAVNFAGRYQGKTTKLMITNNTKSVLQITVDLGVILKPEDSAYQPMVLAGQEMLAVLPKTTGEVEVQTFCGNAPRHCPAQDLSYTFSHTGSDKLIKVLSFIKSNSLFDYLGQSAVWAITNNNDISDAYDPSRVALSKQLIELLISVTGQSRPQYYTLRSDEQVAGAPAFIPKVLKIVAEFEIRLDAPKTLTLGIFDEQGNMAQEVFQDKEFGKMGHRFGVEFEAENVPPGKYYIRLKEGNTVLQEKMVKVE